MKMEDLLSKWKQILLIILIICSICWIHPNFQKGVMISSVVPPASLSLKPKDIVYELNGVRINNINEFQQEIQKIKPNDTVRITLQREVFPFIYTQIQAYPFLAEEKENETFLGLSVVNIPAMNALFENIVHFKEITIGSNDTNMNLDEALKIIEKRLSTFGLRNFWLNKITGPSSPENRIVLKFIKGNDEVIKELLTKRGRFEAKINETLIFSTSDVLKVCLNSQACTFQMFREYEAENETYNKVIWRYYIQVLAKKEAYQRFKQAIENLSIKECVLQICYLNETMDYYLDGEKIEGGSTKISNTSKTMEIDSFLITGKGMSFEEIFADARKMQAFLNSGELPGKFDVLEQKEVMVEKNFLTSILILFASVLVYPIYQFIKNKNIKKEIKSILISFIIIFITIGFVSLFEILINEFTFYGISIVFLLQFLRGRKFRKWILIALIILSLILMISFSTFSIPFLISLLLIEVFMK